MLRQAFAVMLGGRPGPVHLDVPLDVFVETTDEPVPDPGLWRHGVSPRSAAAGRGRGRDPGPAARRRPAADRGRVRRAERRGVRGAGRVRDRGRASRWSPPRWARGPSDPRSPLHLGATGRNGSYQANRAARSADLILAFGTRFDDRSTSSWLPGYTYSIPPARLIQVDVDPAELGRNYPVTLGVAASPKDVLGQLRAALAGRADTGRWLAEIAGWARDWEQHTAAERTADVTPLRPQRVLADLRAVLPPDGILLSDVGAHHNWIVQEWLPGGPGTLLQSWGFASMCFGMAGVLGARLAAPDTPAVAVVGDGGFLMLPSVVATAVQYGIPAVWLVWNNGGYISIRDQQRGYFGPGRELATTFRYAATGAPYSADYAAMARSMGAQGLRVETAGDLGPALKTALGSGLPTVIDVPVAADPAQPSAATWDLPPLPHPEPSFGWPDPVSRWPRLTPGTE